MNEIDKSYAYKAYEDESLHIYLVYAKIIQQTGILNDFKIWRKVVQLDAHILDSRCWLQSNIQTDKVLAIGER